MEQYHEPFTDHLEHLETEVTTYARSLVQRYLKPDDSGCEPIDELREAIDLRIALTEEAGIELPLSRLVRMLGLSPTEREILIVLVAIELDWDLARGCRFAVEHVSAGLPTVGFIARVVGEDFATRGEAIEAFSPGRCLWESRLVILRDNPDGQTSIQHRQVCANRRVVSFLLGQSALSDILLPHARILDSAFWPIESISTQFLTRTKALFELARCASQRIHVSGPAGCGKKLVTRACLPEPRLLVVDPVPLLDDRAGLKDLLRHAILEAHLSRATIYLDFSKYGEPTLTPPACYTVEEVFRNYRKLVVVGSRRPLALSWDSLDVDVPLPQAAERIALWRQALPDEIVEGLDVDRIARQFPLSGGDVDRAITTAHRRAAVEQRAVSSCDLEQAARHHLSCALDELATRVETSLRWKDVVLPESVLEKLDQVRLFGRHRNRMRSEWGFNKRGYGRGLSVLLYGPPGTGKTMIAGLLAGELGLDLFRVDLSRLVSKWVGETEKNLSRIFEAAKRSQAVLLFDEADSLFSKRTQVNSSNDRYANQEVNYLLQLMEQFDGISVLTTNRINGIDEAFKRRLRFRIEVPLPQSPIRADLWRCMIPSQAPLAKRIDWRLLGKRYELSGGQILNAVERAAVYAMECNTPIDFDTLARAAVVECQESGKVVRVA